MKALLLMATASLSLSIAHSAEHIKIHYIIGDRDNKPVQGSTVYLKIGKMYMAEDWEEGKKFRAHRLEFEASAKTDENGAAELEVPVLDEEYEVLVEVTRPQGSKYDIIARGFNRYNFHTNKALEEKRRGKPVTILKEHIPLSRSRSEY